MNQSILQKAADNIRIFSVAMVEKAKSGHPGGAMGGADFVSVLFSEFMNFDPKDPHWAFRDRFFLDPGHMSPMLYSVLSLCGKYNMDDLANFRQWGSITPGHPELDVDHGIENTSGPLGMGHTMGIGAAIAAKFLEARFGSWTAHNIYSFISDGGIQEEISQGAGRIAGYLGLGNLVMFYDSNDIQLSTHTDEVTSEDTEAKYKAWGWHVMTINGNDEHEIRTALIRANEIKDRPTLIIGKTIMGLGAVTESGESFERQVSTHGQPISNAGASASGTIANLGGDPDDPFKIFPEVSGYFKAILEKKSADAELKKQQQKAWEQDNPVLAEKLHRFLSMEIPAIDYDTIPLKENGPTRGSSGQVLGEFGKKIDNMIVMSADLSNSDKTEGFLKNSKAISKGDFSGGFLHAGVSELSMAGIANGIALHGGVFVACGTFFVFSDYMKPAIRMAALMQLPVKYVWTHDSFRVGEDGPTHQPIEHEAQIRLMEQLKNHKGNDSMLVLRPADTWETAFAWKMAMENLATPTGLLLTRQNVTDIKAKEGSTRREDAKEISKGAYVVNDHTEDPDIILAGNGAELSNLSRVAARLSEENNIKCRVISIASIGLYKQMPEVDRNKILPFDKPVFCLTPGLAVVWHDVAGPGGHVHGLNHFGYSAPPSVLDQKFGFEDGQVFEEVLAYYERIK